MPEAIPGFLDSLHQVGDDVGRKQLAERAADIMPVDETDAASKLLHYLTTESATACRRLAYRMATEAPLDHLRGAPELLRTLQMCGFGVEALLERIYDDVPCGDPDAILEVLILLRTQLRTEWESARLADHTAAYVPVDDPATARSLLETLPRFRLSLAGHVTLAWRAVCETTPRGASFDSAELLNVLGERFGVEAATCLAERIAAATHYFTSCFTVIFGAPRPTATTVTLLADLLLAAIPGDSPAAMDKRANIRFLRDDALRQLAWDR
jgi:hypothetical protein